MLKILTSNIRTLKKGLQNIAFFLFSIFSFPLIYQPFHAVVHHSHSTCSQCSVSCSQPDDDSLTVKLKKINDREEPCPICNYHFPLNEIPAGVVSIRNIEIETGLIICDLQRVYFWNPDSNIKSRAPPVA